MLLKSLEHIAPFVAGDHTLLREVIHPENDSLAIPYSLAHASLSPEQRSLPHKLHGAELYIFLSGKGKITVNGETSLVKAQDVVLVPAHAEQYVENTEQEELTFYCVVSPPWKEEGEEIINEK